MFAQPISRLVELGAAAYPLRVRRRLKILNALAALIVVSSAGYALSYAVADARTYSWVIAINLALVAMALCVPLMHLVQRYVSSAVTAVGLSGATAYYAFRLADRAEAESDRLLRNILPENIVERLR